MSSCLVGEMILANLFIHNIALSHAGHVIYEMGAGKPLDPSKLYPDDDDLEAVKDGSVRDVLKYIYDGKGVSIESVRKLARYSEVMTALLVWNRYME